MPTSLHEIPLALLDERPEMLLTLIAAARGPTLDADEWTAVQDTFADLAPATYAADRVYVAKRGGEQVAAFVVEVQRAIDTDKHWSWPTYLTSTHARLRVPTWLVVLTLDARVAVWARAPIATLQGGVFRPLVIGPSEIPRDGTSLELMVLAAMAHGHGIEGAALAARALAAVEEGRAQLDDARVRLYTDLVLASVDEMARHALEAMMDIENWEPQSEYAKRWKAQGVAEGKAEGKAEGHLDGERDALRVLCSVLGIDWSEPREQRVRAAGRAELERLLGEIARDRRWPE